MEEIVLSSVTFGIFCDFWERGGERCRFICGRWYFV